tara:strand:- start:4035 stop:5033 length:999 start_codon:yes stop_codon:yes gene_type:complete
MKKILITGGTGFIGSHLAEFFAKKKYKVTVFDRYNPNYNLGWLSESEYKKKIKFIFGDVRDYDSVFNALKKQDIVLHLAALIGIPYSYISPLAYIKTNFEGTYNVLESSKHLKIKKIFITSTSEVYGSAQYIPMDEKHPLVPQSPYSASKIAADNLALSYFYSFNLPVNIIRPFNTFGPRQSERAIIPTIINQIINKNKKKEIDLGNINPTRDFNFIDDICVGFYKAVISKLKPGSILNLCTGYDISIKSVVEIISKSMDSKVKIKITKVRRRPDKSEVQRLCGSNKKAKKLINWKPVYIREKGFKNAISKTINWYKKKKNQRTNLKKDYIV